MDTKTAVLFGGAGFIGSYLAIELISQNVAESVVLADIASPELASFPKALQELIQAGKVSTVVLDVRQPINESLLPSRVSLIVNLAAVHREPGHKANEYFETNIPGAENITKYAEQVKCNTVVFTSSIAVYGASETVQQTKTEDTLPTPNTPYGISKLVAEKIHIAWQRAEADRKLLIVRPGVIYGAGEKGNVTRMVRAVIGRYFAFTGNRETRKAGGYVKELCKALVWMLNNQSQPGTVLFNFSIDPAPTVAQYAQAIQQTIARSGHIKNVPFFALLGGSYFIAAIGALFGRATSINPTRIRKLRRSNYIVPQVLHDSGYTYTYSLTDAMMDWKQERPEDWT